MKTFQLHPPTTSHGEDGSITTIWYKKSGSTTIIETEVMDATEVLTEKYTMAKTKQEKQEILEQFSEAVDRHNELYKHDKRKYVMYVK